MSETHIALLDIVKQLQPLTAQAVADELVALEKVNKAWPKASAQNWIRELEGLVSTGKLTIDNELVRVATEAARPKQMTLFD